MKKYSLSQNFISSLQNNKNLILQIEGIVVVMIIIPILDEIKNKISSSPLRTNPNDNDKTYFVCLSDDKDATFFMFHQRFNQLFAQEIIKIGSLLQIQAIRKESPVR